jgi:hypothetical protein
MMVLSNRRNGRLSFLQVDCGALQLAWKLARLKLLFRNH